MVSASLALLLALPALATACAPNNQVYREQLHRRQATNTHREAVANTVPTYAPGTVPSNIPNAPGVPDISLLNSDDWPALDEIPPLDSAEMQRWISEIDMSKIPNIAPTSEDGCSNATSAANAGADGNCWWTCGGCIRDTDISFCPQVNSWGLSFDDGPSEDTPRLLNYMAAHNTTSTLFVVGSRAISRPDILQASYLMGHQISVHTWAHNLLTELSNEQIIAELAWGKAVIKAITGVTPNTMRPPQGDIDDRVRYISHQLGLTPILWTRYGDASFDTDDWRLNDHSATEETILGNFRNIIAGASAMSTGFIVLTHDLYSATVDLAIKSVLPLALTHKPTLKVEPIITCLGGAMYQAYAETFVLPASRNTANTSSAASGTLSMSMSGTATGASAAAASGSTTPSSGAVRLSGDRIGLTGLIGLVSALGIVMLKV